MGVIVPGLNKSMKFKPNRAASTRRPTASQTGTSSVAGPSSIAGQPSSSAAPRTLPDDAADQASMPPPPTLNHDKESEINTAAPPPTSSPSNQPVPDVQASSLPSSIFGLPPSLLAGPPSPARTASRAGSVSTSMSGIRASALLGAAASHRATTPGASRVAHKSIKEIRAATKASAPSASPLNDKTTPALEQSAAQTATHYSSTIYMPPTLAAVAESPVHSYSGLPPSLSADPPSPGGPTIDSSTALQTPSPTSNTLSAADIARAAALAVQSITPLDGRPPPPPINLATLKHGRKKVRGRQNAPYGVLPKQRYRSLRNPNPLAIPAPERTEPLGSEGGLDNQATLLDSTGNATQTLANRTAQHRQSMDADMRAQVGDASQQAGANGTNKRRTRLDGETTGSGQPKPKRRKLTGRSRRADITDDDGNLIPQIGPLTQAQLKYSAVLMRHERRSSRRDPNFVAESRKRRRHPKVLSTQRANLDGVEEGAMIGDDVDEGAATLADLATKLTSGKVSKRALRLYAHGKDEAEHRKAVKQWEVYDKWKLDRPIRREMRRVRNEARQQRREAAASGAGEQDEEISDDEVDSADDFGEHGEEAQREAGTEGGRFLQGDGEVTDLEDAAIREEGENSVNPDNDLSQSVHREINYHLGDPADDNDVDHDPLVEAGFHIHQDDDNPDHEQIGEEGEDDFDNYEFGNWAGDASTWREGREEERQNALNLEGRQIIEEDETTAMVNSLSFSKKIVNTPKWTAEDTELFYMAVSQCGECYDLVTDFFPGRTRKNIQSKFKLEGRINPERLLQAIMNRQPLKEDYLQSTGRYDRFKPWDREETFYAESERDAAIARGEIIFDAEGNEIDLAARARGQVGDGEAGDKGDAGDEETNALFLPGGEVDD
ncbi:hypothetical protein BCR39DRAFT_586173 [Naematelia encephala]|uniref:Myb-like domain-containing protein n=1 Tax=Naematelia encephala TaxID=71784 RepID=A0A1Y2BGN4_9TREE|nr:hypothetical protein BCR39DRAFT_586173 [Naematelia encephala]